MRFIGSFAAGLALTLLALPSSAATLTFDKVPYQFAKPYVEDGFIVSDGNFDLAADNGAMHFDISGGPYAIWRSIRLDGGGLFSVKALDVIALAPTILTGGLIGGPMDDILFTGYRGDKVVAQSTGSSQIGDNTIAFGSTFGNISKFMIQGLFASNVDYEGGVVDVHFLVDNVDISPIPLPATGLLLLGAIGALAWARSRRHS